MEQNSTFWTSTALLLTLFALCALQPLDDDFSDIYGPYCEYTGCCNNREDSCSKPILGTLCYCDEFCNRTEVHDCCPDYWSFCKGIQPPTTTLPPPTPRPPPEPSTSCLFEGRTLYVNQTVKKNCNLCRCTVFRNPATNENRVDMLCETNLCIIEQDILSEVRYENHGWYASNYSEFWGRTLSDGISLRLGTSKPENEVSRMNAVKRYYDPARLPSQFESVQKWPRFITGIQDQGWCGASWAISTAAVASDRYGIISRGKEEVVLSPENILACVPKSPRCAGGPLDRAWTYVKKYGIVDEECLPYFPTNTTKCPIRRIGTLKSAGCRPPKYGERTSRYKVGPAYRLGNETDIMYEISRSGPVQATMRVYHDFFSYSNGIYKHLGLSLRRPYGYHSVRIVGWGEILTTSGIVKYWKVANSWGEQWGEEGYFKILRGNNECEIESFVLGVWPEVDRQILLSYGFGRNI